MEEKKEELKGAFFVQEKINLKQISASGTIRIMPNALNT